MLFLVFYDNLKWGCFMRNNNLRKNSEYNKYKQTKSNIRSKNSNNKKSKILYGGIFLLILILAFIFCLIKFIVPDKTVDVANTNLVTNSEVAENSINNANSTTSQQEPITFSLAAIGDVMCHNTQYKDAYNSSTDSYDFSYVFEDIQTYIQSADISIGSLETTFAGKDRGYSNYPTFNSPEQLAYDLSEMGLDVLSTAGNHALDKGFSGLSNTLDVLDDANISHSGTYRTQEDRDSVLIEDVKGVKVAILSYTYGTNGIPVPSDKEFCVNLIDKDLIKKDIENAKSQNADVIISCMHWGIEYQTTPNDEQEDLADFLFENGVDIILGNHPHVLQPMEKRSVTLADGTVKDCFVVYALGNFICDQNSENTRNSIILNLDITKNAGGKISIDKVDYVPIYMYKNLNLSIRKMKLLDIEKSISDYESGTDTSIGSSTYNVLKNELENIKEIIE